MDILNTEGYLFEEREFHTSRSQEFTTSTQQIWVRLCKQEVRAWEKELSMCDDIHVMPGVRVGGVALRSTVKFYSSSPFLSFALPSHTHLAGPIFSSLDSPSMVVIISFTFHGCHGN